MDIDPTAAFGSAMDFAGGMYSASQSRKEARVNRRWQEYMRSTQYQTSVEDMRKAGINPMLAVMKGGASGTGTPVGAHIPDMSGVGSRMVANTVAARQAAIAADIGESTVSKNVADSRRANAEAGVIEQTGIQSALAGIKETEKRTEFLGVQIAEAAERVISAKTHNAQLENRLRLEQLQIIANTEAVKAGIPVKEFGAQLAEIAIKAVNALQDGRARNEAGSLVKDTLNMLQDVNDKTWLPNIWEKWKEKRREFYRKWNKEDPPQ